MALFLLVLLSAVLIPGKAAILFDCPEGTVCNRFTDGCNSCQANANGDTSMAACTEMDCPCYDDDSCVPKCLDNVQCVLATGPTQCDPTETEQTLCPMAGCVPAPEECDYVAGDYFLDEGGNCCQEQCVAKDANGNRCSFEDPSSESVNNQCDPAGTDQDFCRMAKCAPPPEGCEYVPGDYLLDEDTGNCCEEQCVAKDVNGNRCSFEDPVGGRECTQSGEEACPVARCVQPPEGCDYIFDHFVTDDAGVCCPSLCYAVDSNGVQCEITVSSLGGGEEDQGLETATSSQNETTSSPVQDDTTTSSPGQGDNTSDNTNINDSDYSDLKAGDKCTPNSATATTKQGVDPECPVAKCAEAPSGCGYVFDHYVINDAGDCCPALCYAVDGNGMECTAKEASSGIRAGLWLWVALMAILVGN